MKSYDILSIHLVIIEGDGVLDSCPVSLSLSESGAGPFPVCVYAFIPIMCQDQHSGGDPRPATPSEGCTRWEEAKAVRPGPRAGAPAGHYSCLDQCVLPSQTLLWCDSSPASSQSGNCLLTDNSFLKPSWCNRVTRIRSHFIIYLPSCHFKTFDILAILLKTQRRTKKSYSSFVRNRLKSHYYSHYFLFQWTLNPIKLTVSYLIHTFLRILNDQHDHLLGCPFIFFFLSFF